MEAAKKAQLERYGVAVLLVIFAFTLWSSFRGMGGRGARKTVAQASGKSGSLSKPLPEAFQEHWNAIERQAEPAPLPDAVTPMAEGIGYTAYELRDPLKSLLPEPAAPAVSASQYQTLPEATNPPVAPPTLIVQGLVWGGPNPQAIINGHVYGVGASVEGATIRSIGRDGVVVECAGMTMHLAMVKEAEPGALSRAAQWRGEMFPAPVSPPKNGASRHTR